jgi:hypothetical protein
MQVSGTSDCALGMVNAFIERGYRRSSAFFDLSIVVVAPSDL